jgi:hypothetical protein
VNPLLYIIHEKYPSCRRLLHAVTEYTVYVENDIQPLRRAYRHYRGHTFRDILLRNQGVDEIINKNKRVELPGETQMHENSRDTSTRRELDAGTSTIPTLDDELYLSSKRYI